MLQIAALHFKAAGKYDNYRADMQYATCMKKLKKNFDYIEYLQKLVPKYKTKANLKQQILLHIAMQYYYEEKDIKKALTYFKEAIQVNPKSDQLKVCNF